MAEDYKPKTSKVGGPSIGVLGWIDNRLPPQEYY